MAFLTGERAPSSRRLDLHPEDEVAKNLTGWLIMDNGQNMRPSHRTDSAYTCDSSVTNFSIYASALCYISVYMYYA
ncbi:hypothetical protein MAR_001982, partial [Mya arenaria]